MILSSPILFCGTHANHMVSNAQKKILIEKLQKECGASPKLRMKHRITKGNASELTEPCMLTVLTTGYEYFMYITTFEEEQCVFLINKLCKVGFNLPKIIILDITFASKIYENTLLDIEIVKDKNGNFLFLVDNLLIYENVSTNRWGLVKKWNALYELLALHYFPMSKIQKFPIQIKKLFSINKLAHLYRFANRLTYEIKGFNIVPFKPNSQSWVFIYDKSYNFRLNHGEKRNKIMGKPTTEDDIDVDDDTPCAPTPEEGEEVKGEAAGGEGGEGGEAGGEAEGEAEGETVQQLTDLDSIAVEFTQ